MTAELYGILVFAILGFIIDFVLIKGAEKSLLSENENLENDASFKNKIKTLISLTDLNVFYGILVFIDAKNNGIGGMDMSALSTLCIVFIVINFISAMAEGIILSSSIKSGKILEEAGFSKAIVKEIPASILATAGLVYFFLRVHGII